MKKKWWLWWKWWYYGFMTFMKLRWFIAQRAAVASVSSPAVPKAWWSQEEQISCTLKFFFGNLTKIHLDNRFCSGSFMISLSHPFSSLWSLHHQRVRLSRLWSKGGMWRRRRRRRRRWRWPTTPWPGLQPPLVVSVASVGVSQKNFSMSTSFHYVH